MWSTSPPQSRYERTYEHCKQHDSAKGIELQVVWPVDEWSKITRPDIIAIYERFVTALEYVCGASRSRIELKQLWRSREAADSTDDLEYYTKDVSTRVLFRSQHLSSADVYQIARGLKLPEQAEYLERFDEEYEIRFKHRPYHNRVLQEVR